MKYRYPFILFKLVAVLLIAADCAGGEPPKSANPSEKSTTGQDLKEKYKDAATATRNYAAENKERFVASMEKKLKEADARISALAQKSETYKDRSKARADKVLAGLRERQKSAAERLEKVKHSSSDAWQKTKDGFSSAMGKLEEAFEKAKSRFN